MIIQFTPFWQLTRWGFIRYNGWPLGRGCDEWHNKSWFVILPLVGQVIVFPRIPYPRSGAEHLWGYSNGVYEGAIVPGCDICEEIMNDEGE